MTEKDLIQQLATALSSCLRISESFKKTDIYSCMDYEGKDMIDFAINSAKESLYQKEVYDHEQLNPNPKIYIYDDKIQNSTGKEG